MAGRNSSDYLIFNGDNHVPRLMLIRRHAMYRQTRTGLQAAALVLMLSTSGAALAVPATGEAQIKAALTNAYAKVSKVTDGKNADYIPALAHVDPKIFGIALVTA